MSGRRLLSVGAVCVAFLSACGSSPPIPSPTTGQSYGPSPSDSPTATTSGTGVLTLTGQVTDTATVQATGTCNISQGLSLQSAAGSVYQLGVTDGTPGTSDISSQSNQVTVTLSLDTAAGVASNWAGGSGTGTGTVTAPATAGATTTSPGVYTINVVLPPGHAAGLLPGPGAATANEHVTGSWPCT